MIIAVDTETGGLNPDTDALLSISACLFNFPENCFTVFIDPDPSLKIHEEAAKVNGYTPELWKKRGAVPLKQALIQFKSWLPYSGNSPLAHNAEFDKKFLTAAEERAAYPLYLKKIWKCSMQAFMTADDIFELGAANYRLETLARMCGHWKESFVRGDHQSSDDVRACAAGYRWLMDYGLKMKQQIDKLVFENAALRARLSQTSEPRALQA